MKREVFMDLFVGGLPLDLDELGLINFLKFMGYR
jgi:hypothetical protein